MAQIQTLLSLNHLQFRKLLMYSHGTAGTGAPIFEELSMFSKSGAFCHCHIEIRRNVRPKEDTAEASVYARLTSTTGERAEVLGREFGSRRTREELCLRSFKPWDFGDRGHHLHLRIIRSLSSSSFRHNDLEEVIIPLFLHNFFLSHWLRQIIHIFLVHFVSQVL